MGRERSMSGSSARRFAIAAMAACVLCLAWCLAGCSSVQVDDASPRVAEVSVSSTSNMTESSQQIEVRLEFDRPVNVSDSFADDLDFQLNGAAVDSSTIAVETRASGEAVTFTLKPAANAVGVGNGAYFAVYQGAYSIAPTRDDGAVPSITGATGSSAVIDEPLTGVLPSGLTIEVVDQREGSIQENTPARTTFSVTSPATVRAITWFSPDGGTTKLLKHNHTFFREDAESCAQDLADTVNAATGLGISASCNGSTVTLTASSVQDGQRIDPVIVEGPGAAAGVYDPAADGDGAS